MADNRRDIELRIKANDQSEAGLKGVATNIGKVTTELERQAKAALKAAEANAETYNSTDKALLRAQESAVEARKAYEAYYDALADVAAPTSKQAREFDKLGRAADKADNEVAKLQKTLEKADAGFTASIARYEAAQKQAVERQVSSRGSLRFAGALEEGQAQEAARVEAQRRAAEQSSLKFAAAIEQAQRAQEDAARLSIFRQSGEDALSAVPGLNAYASATGQVSNAVEGLAADLRTLIDPTGAARATLDGLEGEVARLSGVIGNADKPIREYQEAIYDLGAAQSDILRQAGFVDAYKQQKIVVDQATVAYQEARSEVIRYAEAIRTADAPNEELTASLRQAEAALEATGGAVEREAAKLAKLKQPLDAARISTDDLAKAEGRLKAAAEATAGATAKLDKAMAGQNSKTGRFLGLRPYEIQNLGFQLNDVFTQLASGTSITQTFAQQSGQILQIFPGLFAKIVAFAPQLLAVALVAGTALSAIKKVTDEEASVRQFSGALELNVDGIRANASALADSAHTLDIYSGSLKDARAEITAFLQGGLDPALIERYGRSAQNLAKVMKIDVADAAKTMADAFTGGWEEIEKLDEKTNFLTLTEAEHIRQMFEDGKAQEARTEAYRIFEERADEAARKASGPWSQAFRDLGAIWDDFLTIITNTGNFKEIEEKLDGITDAAIRSISWLRRVADASADAKNGINGSLERARHDDKFSLLDLAPDDLVRRAVSVATLGASQGRFGKPGALRQAPVPALKATVEGAKALLAPSETERQQKDLAALKKKYEEQGEALTGLTRAQKIAQSSTRLLRAEEKAAADGAAKNLNNQQIAELKALARKNEQLKIDREIAAQDLADQKKAETAGRKAEAAERRTAAADRAEQAKRDALEGQLVTDLSNMDAKIARQQKTSLDERLSAVDDSYAKIYDRIDKLQAAGGTDVKGEDLKKLRTRVDLNKQLLKQQDTLAYYEDSLAALEDRRDASLKSIMDQQAAGAISSADAFNQALAVTTALNPKMADLAKSAKEFAVGMMGADAIEGIEPSPALLAFVEQMRAAEADARNPAARNSEAAKVGQGQLVERERELNDALAERAQLVSAASQLQEKGAITAEEERRRIKAAYDATDAGIRQQVAASQALFDSMREAGVITETQFKALSSQLDVVNAQLLYTDERLQELKQIAEDSIVNGIVGAFESASGSIAGLIENTKSWGEAVDDLWSTTKGFFASFLSSIAKAIVQTLALAAAQQILNAVSGGGGGGIGNFIASVGRALVRHDGGTIGLGASGRTRSVSLADFAGAPRYHNGRVGVGLGPNEHRAILETGETVLDKNDPDNPVNGGPRRNKPGAQGLAGLALKVVNLFDKEQVAQEMLNTRAGEKAVLNIVTSNPSVLQGSNS